MSNWNRCIVALLAMATLLLASSCTARKKMVSPMAHAADYQWITAKMDIEVVSSDSTINDQRSTINLTGTLRMRRDSTIWLSASAMLGMESLRTLITQDSVVLLNRLNQTYIAEPLLIVLANLPETLHAMSLHDCQALLLGNGSSDRVKIQYGPYTAHIHYVDIQWDVPTTFPIKINKKYERIKL